MAQLFAVTALISYGAFALAPAHAQDAAPPAPAASTAPEGAPPVPAPTSEASPTPAADAPPAPTATPEPAAASPQAPASVEAPASAEAPAGAAAVPAPHTPSTTTPETAAPSPAAAPESTTPTTEAREAADGEASPAAAPSPQFPSSALPHDLSPWGMFMAADIVVKAVMIGLVFACFVTWTVWLAKTIEIWAAKAKLRRAIAHIGQAASLGDAAQAFAKIGGAGSVLVREAVEEVERSSRVLDQIDGHGVKERVTSRLSRVEAAAHRRMTLGTGVLATIGSTAPFVGLFGTVWGIMNSFIGISKSQTTNLAIVAPGIAEALLATAIGLVAAIPAVIIYNVFARSLAGYKLLLQDASAGVERLVSHELDQRKLWKTSKPGKTATAAE